MTLGATIDGQISVARIVCSMPSEEVTYTFHVGSVVWRTNHAFLRISTPHRRLASPVDVNGRDGAVVSACIMQGFRWKTLEERGGAHHSDGGRAERPHSP